MGIPRDSGRNIPEPFFDAFASPAVTTGLAVQRNVNSRWRNAKTSARTAIFAGWKWSWKKLLLMKLLPSFYVFTCYGKAKLSVAEKDNDYECPETTASSRRPPESYAGADGGTSRPGLFGRTLQCTSRAAP